MKSKMRMESAWGAIIGVAVLVLGLGPVSSSAADAEYGSHAFGGSSYAQHGLGPAYGGAYGSYGANAVRPTGRFSATYGEYGAVPGYARYGSGSGYGTGPLREAGTGRSNERSGHRPVKRRRHTETRPRTSQQPKAAARSPF